MIHHASHTTKEPQAPRFLLASRIGIGNTVWFGMIFQADIFLPSFTSSPLRAVVAFLVPSRLHCVPPFVSWFRPVSSSLHPVVCFAVAFHPVPSPFRPILIPYRLPDTALSSFHTVRILLIPSGPVIFFWSHTF